MTGPGDEMVPAAGGPGDLRASHADRERVIDTVKAAFARGQLTAGELDARVGQALTARTHAELTAVTVSIPDHSHASASILAMISGFGVGLRTNFPSSTVMSQMTAMVS